MLETKKLEKNLTKYYCSFCDFKCFQKCDWDRHVARPIHASRSQGNDLETKKLEKTFFCTCGKQFKTNSGLWKHQSKASCVNAPSHTKEHIPHFDQDTLLMLINQNKELLEIVKNGTHHINSHNKSFNLQFFLNETCKHAMNITDFVNSIKLQLSDLMDVGELGYVAGMSKIIMNNLNQLDEHVRPVHCTDKKRETMYIKDNDEWNKEDDTKTRLKKAINKLADKNIRLLPAFREKYPDYHNASSKSSDIHDKLVIEVMDTNDDNKDKIIHNISKATAIKTTR